MGAKSSSYAKTIIPDNLILIEASGVKKYKVNDVKISVNHDLTQMNNLTSIRTQNQQIVYKMIDGDATAGTITKVEMRGEQSRNAFRELFKEEATSVEIQLESGVEFWVNSSTTDYTQYLVRARINK